ncbi:MAG: glycosyltransferase involved in cell wall biosynthesis [Hyphomicrobiaceae bacterium]
MTTPGDIKKRDTIAVVLKGYPRLSETFIAQELRGLERRGFKLRFVSLRQPTDAKVHPVHDEIEAPVSYLPEYLHAEPFRVLKGLALAMIRRGFYRATFQWLKDLARDRSRSRVRRFGQACVMAAELPTDVTRLYAHFIHTPAAVTGYASMIAGLPWSCSAHAKDIWTSPDWELQQNLSATDWVATCTRVGWQHLQGLADVPGKVHLIYHGLDLSRFPSPPPMIDLPRDGSALDTPVRIMSVGRAVEKKGFDVLLAALAQLPRDLNWTWHHIGGGGKLRELQAEADRLAIADRITWRGALAQSEVLEAYRNSDLFVLPCRIAADGDRDGLPNVLVEAQSQRLACISTPISGIPELIVHDETGVLVPSEDAAALAGAITDLSQSVERRESLAAAGEERVRSAFDMHAGLTQLAALFPPDYTTAADGPPKETELPEAAE